MAGVVRLQILPGPLVALHASAGQVGDVAALRWALPSSAPTNGIQLLATLPEPIRAALGQLARLQPKTPTPLWLDIQEAPVNAWPWELLAADGASAPFSCNLSVPLARAFPAFLPAPAAATTTHIQVLALAASPMRVEPIQHQALFAALRAIASPTLRVAADDQHTQTTPAALLAHLDTVRPDLLIMLAHGRPGELVLSDSSGDAHHLAAGDLATLLQGRRIPAVVLASCDGATFAPGGLTLAESLLAAGAPSVVAMRGALPTEAVSPFLQALVRSIGQGEALEVAAARGRQALIAAHGGSAGDWALPVCWQRMPGAPLRQIVAGRAARRVAINASKPGWAKALTTGGWLGLMAACVIAPLLPVAGLASAALPSLLGNLGLNVFAGYLGTALAASWEQHWHGELPSEDLRVVCQEITEQHADAAAEIEQLARESGALHDTAQALNDQQPGYEALRRGIAADLAQHGDVLDRMRAELGLRLDQVQREVLGLRGDVQAGFAASRERDQRAEAKLDRANDALREVRADTSAIREVVDAHEQARREQQARFAREREEYLTWVIERCQTIGRSRLSEQPRAGGDGKPVEMYLQDVYTALTTERWLVTRTLARRYLPARLQKAAERVSQVRGLDRVMPEWVRQLVLAGPGSMDAHGNRADPEIVQEHQLVPVQIMRPELAVEAFAPLGRAAGQRERRIVLLGEPGSGKSTVLRYAAVLLAQAARDQTPPALPGWQSVRIPILVPLGSLAEQLQAQPDSAPVLRAAIEQVLLGEDSARTTLAAGLDTLLAEAIILFDGLDELSVDSLPDGSSLRLRAATGIRALARSHPSTVVVVTCRVRPYRTARKKDGVPNWQFDDPAWEERTIQPFALGQVRSFAQAWYRADARMVGYAPQQAKERAERLLAELDDPRLREALAPANSTPGAIERTGKGGEQRVSPLLLTMVTILHANNAGERLPRERDALYEELVQLLLQRWEPRRSEPFHRRHDLISRLHRLAVPHGLREPSIEVLREMIHKLAYDAHCQAAASERGQVSGDGRGYIDARIVEGELLQLFRDDLGYPPDLAGSAQREFLNVLEQEAGLLQAPDRKTYALPHLTFQEYLAACYLADRNPTEMVQLLARHWQSADADRWAVVIDLLIGRLTKGKVEGHAREWLDYLLNADLDQPDGRTTTPKPLLQRQRDALLAADCLAILTRRSALKATRRQEYARNLREALRTIVPIRGLTRADLCLSPADRARAAIYLANCETGDQIMPDARPGVCTLPSSLQDSYWATPIPAGSYPIANGKATLELAEFRISRYPVTVWQFRQFVDAGGYENQAHWSQQGWEWKLRGSITKPYLWDDSIWSANNQPVIGISWYEAYAFCRWLDAVGRAEGWLKNDWEIRLPSEAEWEVAAMWDGTRSMMQDWSPAAGEIWQNVQETGIGRTSPVGLFPQGVSWCGAQDMAGNAWEWCGSAYRGYPAQAHKQRADFEAHRLGLALRGSAFYNENMRSGWGARSNYFPLNRNGFFGCRVCVCSHFTRLF